MAAFSFSNDNNWVKIPYGTFLNAPFRNTTTQEITADTDFDTISEILSNSLIEIVKKSFEMTANKDLREQNIQMPTPTSILQSIEL